MSGGLITVVFFLVSGSLVAILFYLEKKRREQLAVLAQNLGFTFHQRPPSDLQGKISSFPVMTSPRSASIYNTLKGERDSLKVFITDVRQTRGTGKHKNTTSFTAAVLVRPGSQLPQFEISPENFIHKIASTMGFQDIDLPSYPEFSKRYLLRGKDEVRIKQVLTPSVVKFFESQKNLYAEGSGDCLVIYRKPGKLKVGQVTQFLNETMQLSRLLLH